MKKSPHSFAKRLSRSILLLTSLILVFALGLSFTFSRYVLAKEAQTSTKNLMNSTINEIEQIFARVEEEVYGLSWIVSEKRDDVDYLYHITEKLVEENEINGSAIAFVPYYFKDSYFCSPYSYVDPLDHKTKSKQLGNTSYDYFSMDWFQIPYLLGKPCWSEPYFDEGGGDTMMTTYSYPLKDENGDIFAIFTADLSLKWINTLIEKIKPYPNSSVMLVSRNGTFISMDNDTELQGETVFSRAIESGIDRLMEMAGNMVAGQTGFVEFTLEGMRSFAVYGPLFNGWSAMFTCTYNDILYRATILQFFSLIIAILGLIVLFIFCRKTINNLTKPLRQMTDAAKDIADGNFNAVLPEIDTNDDIQQLRDSFSHMEVSLTDYMEHLKASTAENQRFESELNIANKIQMSMVPNDFPNSDKVSICATLKPAKEVGGDLYDFFIQENKLYFAIGDVSGKGVPASMFMAITRSAFRFITKMNLSLDEVMYRINNAVSEGNSSGMFVTMFIACLNLETGELTYCNAGHNPMIINGTYLDVKPNLALGLFEDFKYHSQRTVIEKGSCILAYTDGVTEAERADKKQYSEERLLKFCLDHKSLAGTDRMCDKLLEDIRNFTEGNDQNDDITILTIKY